MSQQPALAPRNAIALVALCALFIGSTGTSVLAASHVEENAGVCIADGHFDAAHDYFPHKVAVGSAEHFSVAYEKSYKVLTNKATGETYVLVQCGAPVPDAASLPAEAKVFTVPVKKVALTETVQLAFVERLGLLSSVSYMQWAYLATSPCAQALLASGDIAELPSNRTQVVAGLDVIFGGNRASGRDSPVAAKVVSFSASADPGPLHRAEWLKFMAAFFNAEQRATTIYAGIEERYECHAANAEFLAAAVEADGGERPLVAWMAYLAPAAWNHNQALWEIHEAAYKVDLIRAAGAEVPPAAAAGNVAFETAAEFVRVALADAALVIDETYQALSLEDFSANLQLDAVAAEDGGDASSRRRRRQRQRQRSVSDLPFWSVAPPRVWRLDGLGNAAGSFDWFEGAVAAPDAVLADIISVVWEQWRPAGVNRGEAHSRTWLRRVEPAASGDSRTLVGPAACQGDAAAAAPAAPCSLWTADLARDPNAGSNDGGSDHADEEGGGAAGASDESDAADEDDGASSIVGGGANGAVSNELSAASRLSTACSAWAAVLVGLATAAAIVGW